MSRERVLSLLRESGEEYLSGEAMSRQLGISRAAVWKAIEALRQEGYEIEMCIRDSIKPAVGKKFQVFSACLVHTMEADRRGENHGI